MYVNELDVHIYNYIGYMHTLGAPVLNQDIQCRKNVKVLNTVFDHKWFLLWASQFLEHNLRSCFNFSASLRWVPDINSEWCLQLLLTLCTHYSWAISSVNPPFLWRGSKSRQQTSSWYQGDNHVADRSGGSVGGVSRRPSRGVVRVVPRGCQRDRPLSPEWHGSRVLPDSE